MEIMTTGREAAETAKIGTSQILSKAEAINILQKIKNNYRRYYTNLTREEALTMAEIWVEGLQRVDGRYAKQALDYFIFESTEPFPPTIGQFLSKANDYRIAYERKHPVIRNAWEIKDES